MKTAIGSLGIAALIAITGVAAPAAGAHTRTPAAAGTTTTQRVQVRLRGARAALAHAAAELAGMRGELASSRTSDLTLRAQVSQLQRTLAQTAKELNAARAQVASAPTPLAVAVEQVRHEVAYAQGGLPYPRGQLISEAAMDYVAGHVSATAYGYLQTFFGVVPPFTANGTLGAQAGICGPASIAFAAIVRHFGFTTRSVNFYYDDPPPISTPDSHVGVEVLYDGSWHFFDPTFGLFWTDAGGNVLSIAAVRAGAGSLQKDVASFTNVFEDAEFGNDTWFETDPATKLAIGLWTWKG